ncbi:unnamed protein product, partial [Durusdinium trenchii]
MLETCEIFDLAEEGEIDIEESFAEGFEMMVAEDDMVEHFDLTMTDMDDHWTMEDNFTQEIDLVDYKMDYNDLFQNVDFIALKTSKVETFLRDSQGRMIPVEEKVAMTLRCRAADGRPVQLKEIFAVANVKQPLVAMGKWMKKGWMTQNVKSEELYGSFLNFFNMFYMHNLEDLLNYVFYLEKLSL